MAEKQKRGAPTKEQAMKNRLSRLETDVDEALLKGKELAAENYLKYVEVLDNAALGKLKGITPTNQISSAKVMKEYVENMMKEEAKKLEEGGGSTVEEDVNPAPLISLVAKQG